MDNEIKRLPDSELKIMQALWQAATPLTRAQLEQLLNKEDEWAPTTVLSLIGRLENKGFVERIKEGKGYLYLALISQHKYMQYESKLVLNKLFGGSPTTFMAALYDGKGLTDDEITELEEYLKKLKEEEQ